MGSPKNQGDRTDLQSIKRALESNSSIKTLLDSDLEINSHGPSSCRKVTTLYGHTQRLRTAGYMALGKDRYRARQEPP